MTWIFFALGAALSWGIYGPILHKGQVQLGNPLRALLCVGVAYFLVGVLVPAIALGSQGELKGFNSGGVTICDPRRRFGRHRRGVYHLGVPDGRHTYLCHAAGIRTCSGDKRPLLDGNAPAQNGAESAAVPRIPVGLHRGGPGAVLQAAVRAGASSDVRWP